MAKPNQLRINDAAVNSLIDTLVGEAEARLKNDPVTGTSRKKDSRSKVFLDTVNNILNQKRVSDASTILIPISSKTNKLLTEADVEQLTKQAIANGVAIAEEFIFLEKDAESLALLKSAGFSDQQIKDAEIKWANQSAMNTRIGGTRASDPFSVEYATINDKFIIKNCPPPGTTSLKDWAKNIIIAQIAANPVQAIVANSKPVKWGLIVKQGSILSLYIINVSATVKGQFTVTIDFNAYNFSDVSGPFMNVAPPTSDASASNLAIAHMKSVVGSKGEAIVAYYEEAINILEDKVKKASSTTKPKYESALAAAQTTLREMSQNITLSRGYSTTLADLMDPTTRLPMSVNNPIFQNKSLKTDSQGNVTIPVFGQDSVGNVTQRTMTISSQLIVAQALSRSDINTLSTGYNFFNSGVQRALETLYGKNLVTVLAETATSLAPINYLLLSAMGIIFSNKKMLVEAKKQAPKSKPRKKYIAKIGEVGKKIKTAFTKYKKSPKSTLEKAAPKINSDITIKGFNYVGNLGNESFGNTKLLSIINANLRQEVIAKMKYPALVNRTGRFASSVRAIDIVNSQVNATFMKSPYSVFMQQGGKTPWNTTDRDPVKIINEAIYSISSKHNLGISKVNIQ
jgi:hypothetical protein